MEGIDADVAHREALAQACYLVLRRIVARAMAAMVEVAARSSREEMEPGREWLTPTEREIMRLRRAGWTVAEIAAARHVEKSRVHTHLRDARRRLRTRIEATLVSPIMAKGWFTSSSEQREMRTSSVLWTRTPCIQRDACGITMRMANPWVPRVGRDLMM